MATTIDLEYEKDRRKAESLDDVDLVHCALVLNGEIPNLTPRARRMRRILFGEIAHRWMPCDVFAAAVERLEADDA